jgi:hypothetical protein
VSSTLIPIHPESRDPVAPAEPDSFGAASPPPAEPSRESLARELERLEAEAHHAADLHGRAAKRWRVYQVVGGALAAILATSAGITGMAEAVHPTLAGMKALGAAAIGAAMTAMEPSRRSEEARTAYTRFLALHHRAHRVRNLDLPAAQPGEIRRIVEELAETHDELAMDAPPVPLRRRERNRA